MELKIIKKTPGIIREATLEDVDRLLELYNLDKNTSTDEYNYQIEGVRGFLVNSNIRIYVYVEDERILGLLHVEIWKTANYSIIDIIIVEPKYQNRGIGTLLIQYAEKDVKRYKINYMYTYVQDTNELGKRFFQNKKLNYKPKHKLQYLSKIIDVESE